MGGRESTGDRKAVWVSGVRLGGREFIGDREGDVGEREVGSVGVG